MSSLSILPRFLTLSADFPRECFLSLQQVALKLPVSSVRKWGDAIMAADLACEDDSFFYFIFTTNSIEFEAH